MQRGTARLAALLIAGSRDGDLDACLSGGKFVLLPATACDAACAVAKRLREAVEQAASQAVVPSRGSP